MASVTKITLTAGRKDSREYNGEWVSHHTEMSAELLLNEQDDWKQTVWFHQYQLELQVLTAQLMKGAISSGS